MEITYVCLIYREISQYLGKEVEEMDIASLGLDITDEQRAIVEMAYSFSMNVKFGVTQYLVCHKVPKRLYTYAQVLESLKYDEY